MNTVAGWVTMVACVLACGPGGVRWLRVAQREHYIGGSMVRFAWRWWRLTPASIGSALVAVTAAVVTWLAAYEVVPQGLQLVGVATAVAVAGGPPGLGLRGRTSTLVWTRRLRTLAGVSVALAVVCLIAGIAAGLAAPVAALVALAVPLLVDVACWITAPIERRLGAHFVEEAQARLARVQPLVVAITGSYGKTSTKGHIAQLVAPARAIVATPASFNNRAGLARSVNEHLADGTEVFVAEMGMYAMGEIAAMCAWCPPTISAITAIGPVHLERMGTEERILEAKSEITEGAAHVLLNVDNHHLAGLADRLSGEGRHVVRCSATDPLADVAVLPDPGGATCSLHLDGALMAEGIPAVTGVQPTNLAIAVGVAQLLGVETPVLIERMGALTPASHRLQATTAASGAQILDDTYNSNPAGAQAALEALAALAATQEETSQQGTGRPGPGRRVVVTPGMVELGSRQFEENQRFAEAVAAAATDLVIVGHTNRAALRSGVARAASPTLEVREVATREQAVAWVRGALGARDVVLYENDLPDHYP